MAHQCELTYFLKCHEFVKIGKTCNLKPRVDDLQVGNPYDLELIGVSFKAENNLQEKFLHLQHKREWFHLTNELKDYIAKNAACPDEDGNFEEPEDSPTYGWRCSSRQEWRDCTSCKGEALRTKMALEKEAKNEAGI